MRILQACRDVLLSSVAISLCAGALGQAGPSRSVITIHVGKTGLFSGFGHEHTVIAPISSGSIDEKARQVQITVQSKQMKVTDSEIAEKDRVEVQSTMLGPKVLDTGKYPEIRFQSSRVEPAGPERFRVTGMLDLHGTRRELTFEVNGSNGHYRGKTKFKQTDFGIQPVSGGAGTVKVKDELELQFDVYSSDLHP